MPRSASGDFSITGINNQVISATVWDEMVYRGQSAIRHPRHCPSAPRLIPSRRAAFPAAGGPSELEESVAVIRSCAHQKTTQADRSSLMSQDRERVWLPNRNLVNDETTHKKTRWFSGVGNLRFVLSRRDSAVSV